MAKLLESWDTPPAKQAAESSARQTIVDLLFMTNNLRVAHWQASTRTNEHQALGDLYGAVTGLIDDYAEALMGTDGSREFPGRSGELVSRPVVSELMSDMQAAALALCQRSKTPDLSNIAADVLQAVNKARYLLSDV